MTEGDSQHVFISYVREDSDNVDRLCAVLEAAQIPYWRDRTALAPGDAWKAKIRTAIQKGALVFLACFSEHSRAREKSTMNEELTLAVDEFRKMPPGRTWLIPVRFDDGLIPEWDLGSGRMLDDLNYVDLFGEGYSTSAVSLVTTINRLLGEEHPSPATMLAAVAEATDADRPGMLTRLTKEMLPDVSRRIELDELVSQEAKRILDAMRDEERFPRQLPRGISEEELYVELGEIAHRYWKLVEPFCHSLRVAARWGKPESLAPWISALKGMVAAANKLESGNTLALALRHVPGVVAIMTAALACVSAGQWGNLKTLLIDPSIASPQDNRSMISLIAATHPWRAFGNNELFANAVARAATSGEDLSSALQYFTSKGGGKLYTPVAEWLYVILKPIFSDQFHDEDEYAVEFDRAEVFLGLLSVDCSIQMVEAESNSWVPLWFGRSSWRAARGYAGDPVAEFDRQLSVEGAIWPPLRAGLFGADEARARTVMENYVRESEKRKNNWH